jgi:hypothetical protein
VHPGARQELAELAARHLPQEFEATIAANPHSALAKNRVQAKWKPTPGTNLEAS